MKKIYVLYGAGDKGKSETIKILFEKLKKKYPDFKILEDPTPIYDGDIRIIIKINGKIIAIESQGDPNSRIFASIDIFINIPADIIICATRTKGATVNIIEEQKNQYDIDWIKKNPATSESLYESENYKIADLLLEKIGANL